MTLTLTADDGTLLDQWYIPEQGKLEGISPVILRVLLQDSRIPVFDDENEHAELEA